MKSVRYTEDKLTSNNGVVFKVMQKIVGVDGQSSSSFIMSTVVNGKTLLFFGKLVIGLKESKLLKRCEALGDKVRVPLLHACLVVTNEHDVSIYNDDTKRIIGPINVFPSSPTADDVIVEMLTSPRHVYLLVFSKFIPHDKSMVSCDTETRFILFNTAKVLHDNGIIHTDLYAKNMLAVFDDTKSTDDVYDIYGKKYVIGGKTMYPMIGDMGYSEYIRDMTFEMKQMLLVVCLGRLQLTSKIHIHNVDNKLYMLDYLPLLNGLCNNTAKLVADIKAYVINDDDVPAFDESMVFNAFSQLEVR